MASYYDEVSSTPEPDTVDFNNMFSAAQKLSRVMKKAGIRHAFMGGFACRIIGSTRETSDLGCCVETNWKKLREVLSSESGFELPKSKLVGSVMRIYAVVNDEKVQIDVLRAGGETGPWLLDEKATVVKGLPTLSLAKLLCTKIHAFYQRERHCDGLDILFLLGSIDKVAKYQISTQEAEYFIDNFDWHGYQDYKKLAIRALLSQSEV